MIARFALLLLLVPGLVGPAAADEDAEARLAWIAKERQKLAAVKRGLEARLGREGAELKRLDQALSEARRASRKARAELASAERKLARLEARKKALEDERRRLRRILLDQAEAAWLRGGTMRPWLAVFTGADPAEMPHRGALLSRVMASIQSDRERYRSLIEELDALRVELDAQRARLTELAEARSRAERRLAARVKEKRRLVARLKRELAGKKSRARRLAEEEAALKRLIEGLGPELASLDAGSERLSVRARRGRLPWPLRGKVVARFHSRPKPGAKRLNGVRLAPLGEHREVRAMGAGRVRFADWFGGYGLMMIVDYGDGVLGIYAHNDVLFKQLGDWVEPGEVIALAGSTGLVEETRLYFEIRDHGRPRDPARWCRG